MPRTVHANSRKARTRTHTLGGCGTCRRKHLKCDQARPTCGNCAKAKTPCEGFQKSLRWSSTTLDVDDDVVRDYLYTEDARLSMSEALSADLTNGCIDSTLSAIEVRARNNSGSLNTVNVGPFSAFNVDRPPSTSHDQVELSSNTPETNQAQTAQSSDLFVEGCNQIITTDWDLLLGTGGLLEWDDLFGSDFDAANSQFDFAPNTYVQQDLLGDSWQCQQSTDSLAVNSGVVASTGLSGEQVDVDHVDRSPPTGLPNDTLIFAQAPALLRQFKDRWLSYFSPIPTPAKSPWEVLNLANALGTLADVTFMGTEDVSHARRANLFGLLACTMKIGSGSSESMSNTSSHDIAEMMQYCANRAKFHMQQSLQHETCEPRKSKYKDQLMAILSLGLYAAMAGQQNDARCYIVDTERLLRLRGLTKRDVSRRIRLLHHVYTWIRIVGESTFVINDQPSWKAASSHRQSILSSVDRNSTGRQVEMDDFLRLEERAEDFTSQKARHEGLRDIHLEDVRDWDDTLYTKIYGIPEVWLSLLSRTTRLANTLEKNAHRSDTIREDAQYQKKIGHLEHMISNFAAESAGNLQTVLTTTSVRGHFELDTAIILANRQMVHALSSALLIFFYRRVRNVHTYILQGQVRDVADSLDAFDATMTQHNVHGLRNAWPAFIAGCEARNPDLQARIASWLEKSDSLSSINVYRESLVVMREVWQTHATSPSQSDPRAAPRRSWVDVLRDRSQWLMLY